MRWATAAENVPTRIAANAPDSTAASRNTAAISCVKINHRPKWRNGRLRCGDDVESAAADMTTTAGGKTGGPSTSNSRLMTLRSSSTTSQRSSSVRAIPRTTATTMSRASERRPRTSAANDNPSA
jgi:hypothetical protein